MLEHLFLKEGWQSCGVTEDLTWSPWPARGVRGSSAGLSAEWPHWGTVAGAGAAMLFSESLASHLDAGPWDPRVRCRGMWVPAPKRAPAISSATALLSHIAGAHLCSDIAPSWGPL